MISIKFESPYLDNQTWDIKILHDFCYKIPWKKIVLSIRKSAKIHILITHTDRVNSVHVSVALSFKTTFIMKASRLYTFCTKGTRRPPFGTKSPPFGAKHPPPVYCSITVINLKPTYHLYNDSNFICLILDTTMVCLNFTTQLGVVCVIKIILCKYLIIFEKCTACLTQKKITHVRYR